MTEGFCQFAFVSSLSGSWPLPSVEVLDLWELFYVFTPPPSRLGDVVFLHIWSCFFLGFLLVLLFFVWPDLGSLFLAVFLLLCLVPIRLKY